ncbi:hypothetical protein PGUG_02791 [Meyerozyma guilliermondii ATCC 6260]|uniref:HTH La-type RNA-binding domain-containing protein n=1 Tax=Meyerozyma guilliermondii (strain ATCC 6260 / CBS 566 / DSM 6381 / JCM 1539 / NBRC 10279 / NRRL Y-324) TaxID=294746 RepID=A5DHP0_PICGU|nr:uncharacterized protein PGUG_02791 [Meyerozyma guilliermondii ATCC 6260]EDK38693.2 hypothetical protein PGUG_02791 [Meyerozyma guilliermondii ATCC 6260]
MSVSYANIAATGSNSESQTSTPVSEVASLEVNDTEVQTSPNNSETTTVPIEQPTQEKPKKTLAPAPVPTKSVWGSTVSPHNISVDENKWPTPDKVKLEQETASKPSQKFIKPVTNKWVPINAKVTLASPRPGSQKPRNRKKRQGQNQTSASAHTVVPHSPPSTESSSPSTQSPSSQATQSSQSPKVSEDEKSNGQQKNFRRFNGNGSPQFKPRFGSPQQPPQFFPQGQGQNGFYHPQPYQNFQGYPRGQYRAPRNGAPIINGGFVPAPFANGMMGYPHTQIPPPISPKQDPSEALTQQIDYYFSLENLIKDIFLRKHMHEQDGWVPLSLILNFKRVKIILNGIQNSSDSPNVDQDAVVLASLDHCKNLDIDYVNGKTKETATVADINLRVKDNYKQWLLPEA